MVASKAFQKKLVKKIKVICISYISYLYPILLLIGLFFIFLGEDSLLVKVGISVFIFGCYGFVAVLVIMLIIGLLELFIWQRYEEKLFRITSSTKYTYPAAIVIVCIMWAIKSYKYGWHGPYYIILASIITALTFSVIPYIILNKASHSELKYKNTEYRVFRYKVEILGFYVEKILEEEGLKFRKVLRKRTFFRPETIKYKLYEQGIAILINGGIWSIVRIMRETVDSLKTIESVKKKLDMKTQRR